tara:strand:+ start:406 stop:702 length:297 start_codon:yes stop_codon:yes gene_type:complete
MKKMLPLMLVSTATLAGSLVAIILNQNLDMQTNAYISLAGVSVICLIYSVYMHLKTYIRALVRPIDEHCHVSALSKELEISDDEITEEIERHMDDHKH